MTMKKLINSFIITITILLVLILLVDINNDKYNITLKKTIKKHTDITNIEYINKYNDYYLVLDKDYLYLIDNELKIISQLDRRVLHENKNNYDLIYQDEQIMYFKDAKKDNKLTYQYYDIYTYKLIKTITVG